MVRFCYGFGFDSVSVGHHETSIGIDFPPDRVDKEDFICNTGGTYSVTVQADGALKSTYFGAAVVQDEKMLDLGLTDQGSGVISLAGDCA